MRTLIAVSLVALMTVSSVADEPAKKKRDKGGNSIVKRLMTSLEAVSLTEDQTATIKAAASKFEATSKELREAGLTADVRKKVMTATKEARESGAKGKEVAAKVKESLTSEEAALIAKMDAANKTLRTSIAAVLTPEQLEAIPEKARRQFQPRQGGKAGAEKGKGKGKGKGKKKDQA
ncbi:hypothetical protein [Neorhodopirellula lusitana]|uniref:hypothetical protein n=1 Tax=Neorhodopirellula lusitana TaxID=445327 RepID=UPI00385077D1